MPGTDDLPRQVLRSWGAAFILPSYIRTKDVRLPIYKYYAKLEKMLVDGINLGDIVDPCPDIGNYPQDDGPYMCFQRAQRSTSYRL